MKVRTESVSAGLPANFAKGELLEIHYDKLDENDGRLKLPFDKNSKVTGIDGGHVIGADTHPTWNIIEKRAKGTGKVFFVKEGYGYIETEKFGELQAQRVSFTGQPTRGSIFEMVITYGAHQRPPYIGYQSAHIDPELRFILVPNSRAL